MNYRHAFHAGNFADVMKHIALVRVIERLKLKEKPFRFIDTHAGTGLYDLSASEAQRSGEWLDGVGAILADEGFAPDGVVPDSELAALLQPYFDVLSDVNNGQRSKGNGLHYYPGAGEFARRLMRTRDRLVLNELHDEDAVELRRRMGRDERVRALHLDGWTAVKSLLPPKERRGVMLIDPPFEQAGEFKRMEAALKEAEERFASGVTMLWYPIKVGGAAEAFVNRMSKTDHRRLLCAELLVRHRDTVSGLNGSGLLIHNPPYGLDEQLQLILPYLVERLGRKAGAGYRVEWLVGE